MTSAEWADWDAAVDAVRYVVGSVLMARYRELRDELDGAGYIHPAGEVTLRRWLSECRFAAEDADVAGFEHWAEAIRQKTAWERSLYP
jgi:hypothetical protein